MAELEAGMAAEANSSACLEARTCLPIGGHSVWAAIPPLPAAGSGQWEDSLPITLVVAHMDSTAFSQPEALVSPAVMLLFHSGIGT